MDSRVLCDQDLNERMKQCFASLSGVVHKLEKTEVQGEEPFHRIDMDFTKTVAIFISSVLASSVVDALIGFRGSYVPTLSKNRHSFLTLLKSKG